MALTLMFCLFRTLKGILLILYHYENHMSFIIEMDLKEIGLDYVAWICLAQDRGQG